MEEKENREQGSPQHPPHLRSFDNTVNREVVMPTLLKVKKSADIDSNSRAPLRAMEKSKQFNLMVNQEGRDRMISE